MWLNSTEKYRANKEAFTSRISDVAHELCSKQFRRPMKQIISTQLILIWLSATAFSQNYEYDVQSCFNENETVQEALYESLMSNGELDALNSMLEIPISEADVLNLRPLSNTNATDVDLCNYSQSAYSESKWGYIGNLYYIYHYRANDFYFNVYITNPKSIFDPDFSSVASTYRITNVQGFDVQFGFLSGGVVSEMKSYPGLELPESAN